MIASLALLLASAPSSTAGPSCANAGGLSSNGEGWGCVTAGSGACGSTVCITVMTVGTGVWSLDVDYNFCSDPPDQFDVNPTFPPSHSFGVNPGGSCNGGCATLSDSFGGYIDHDCF